MEIFVRILPAFLLFCIGFNINLQAMDLMDGSCQEISSLRDSSRIKKIEEKNPLGLITSPFLFEIEFGNNTSLLLGSAHAIKLEEFPQDVREKLLSARTLVLETLQSFKDSTKDELIKSGAIRAPDSERWLDQIEEPLRTYLIDKLAPIIQRDHPDLTVGDLTSLTAYLKYDSPGNNEGMDYQLQKLFEPSWVFGLEDTNEVFTLLEGHLDLSHFKKTLAADYAAEQKGEETPTDYSRRWIEYHYCNGELVEMKEFFTQSGVLGESNSTRNRNWVPKFDHYHLNNSSLVLFVVGFSHLVGENGLLNLLLKKGYAIRQITPDGSFKPLDIGKFV